MPVMFLARDPGASVRTNDPSILAGSPTSNVAVAAEASVCPEARREFKSSRPKGTDILYLSVYP